MQMIHLSERALTLDTEDFWVDKLQITEVSLYILYRVYKIILYVVKGIAPFCNLMNVSIRS